MKFGTNAVGVYLVHYPAKKELSTFSADDDCLDSVFVRRHSLLGTRIPLGAPSEVQVTCSS